MKPFQIIYTPHCCQIISHLSPNVKRPLRQLIEALIEDPYLGKQLQDEFVGLRSLRYKRYWVIYRIREKNRQIEIILAGPRFEIYQELTKWVGRVRTN